MDSHLKKTVECPIHLKNHHINQSGRRLPNPPCHFGVQVFGLSFCFLVGRCQVNPRASSSLDQISSSQRSILPRLLSARFSTAKIIQCRKGATRSPLMFLQLTRSTQLPNRPNRILLEFQPFFVVRSNSLRLVGCC